MSSLKFLTDNDVIELLGEYVLKAYLEKKEKELKASREFHMNTINGNENTEVSNLSFTKKLRCGYVNDINKIPHYQITSIFNITKNITAKKNKEILWSIHVKKIIDDKKEKGEKIPNAIAFPKSIDVDAFSLSWLNEKPHKRIQLYEKFLKEHISHPWQFSCINTKKWAFH